MDMHLERKKTKNKKRPLHQPSLYNNYRMIEGVQNKMESIYTRNTDS